MSWRRAERSPPPGEITGAAPGLKADVSTAGGGGRARDALQAPGVRSVIVVSFLARLPAGMYTVGLLLLLQQRSGSFAAAGAAVASYSVAGGLGAPVLGRLADVRGTRPVLLGAALVHAAALFAVAFVPGASPWVVIGLVAAGGAVVPPVPAAVRSLWSHRFGADERALRAVLGIEAVLGESVFVLGPLLVAGISLLLGPAAAVGLAAGVTLAGVAGLVSLRLLRGVRTAPALPAAGSTWSMLSSSGLRVLVCAQVLSFAGFAATEVGVLAVADQRGHPSAGGVLLAVWAGASMVGAMIWGARARWPGSPVWQLLTLLSAAATGSAVLALLVLHPPGAGWVAWAAVAAGLVPAGLFLAPAAVAGQTMLARVTDPARRVESFAWMSTAALLGSSTGTAAAGAIVQARGSASAMVLAVTAALAAVVMVAVGRAALTR